MKKKLLILFGVSLASIIFIIVIIYKSNKKQLPKPSPTPQMSPSPSAEVLQNNLPNETSFNNSLLNLNEQYPWYSKLPIDTDLYHVVYDFSENKFRIRLKKPTTTNQLEKIIQSAVSSLREIEVPEPIKYYVLDVNGNRL
jgi:hypothetical protein